MVLRRNELSEEWAYENKSDKACILVKLFGV